ncbi:MAG: EAL domain-containing protein [Colwellia sp.]|nr:EAL domain-containing protein [Colwellia sp.]
MRKTFISVPTKLLTLIIVTLLCIGIGFSSMSLWRLQEEFKQFQQDTLLQGQSQFNLHNEILRSNLRIWLESFSDVIRVTQQDDFNSLANGLEEQFDALELNFNVENIWLLDHKLNPLFTTGAVPDYVNQSATRALNQQTPQEELHCQESCQQLVSIPLLNQKGQLAIVSLSTSLVDMLFSINRSLKSDVAIVSFDNYGDTRLKSVNFISTSNLTLFEAIFNESSADIRVVDVKNKGLQVDFTSSNYLLNLMPLAQNQQQYYLALVDDVTPFKAASDHYRQQFLITAIIIFITLAALVYWIASPFTKRLLILSKALPLLAKKEFDQFRQAKLNSPRIFSDELDVLTDATVELSYELEQLNIEINQKTKELENIAMYDLLTGLPNRNMLNYQLRKSIASINVDKKGIAVLFLDLDDFKKVNDSHGHGEGDRLLIVAADRVRLSVKNIDLACRFGGDEFVVVLSQLNSCAEAEIVAEKILLQFREPIKLSSSLFYVSTSIGIVYSEDENAKADDLISHADIAMYEAKDHGGSQYHIYHDDMYQKVAHRVMLEGEVRQALAKKQFSLSLQPQLEAKSKKLYGFEALLRWHHPERGMISPDDFIPILENSEHMIILGYWVIRRCFELVIKIRNAGLKDVRIAINLSAIQFTDPKLFEYFEQLLIEFDLGAEHFELEITEQTLVKDVEQAIQVMDRLKEIGFTFAIDDFGTGYSSLAYLKKMPIDVIKIDKSFVFGMLENHADYQIIMSTIAMVKNLGLTAIAEGVESSAQLRSLTEHNCDLIQGYYFSKPIPEKEILAFIEEHISDGYWKTKAENPYKSPLLETQL